MICYNENAYDSMLGNIEQNALAAAGACISQCTGCMCSCKCSCSGVIFDFEWEKL